MPKTTQTRSRGRRPRFERPIDDLGALVHEQAVDDRLRTILLQTSGQVDKPAVAPSATASLDSWVTWLKELLETVNIKEYPTWLLPSKLKKVRSLTDRLAQVINQV